MSWQLAGGVLIVVASATSAGCDVVLCVCRYWVVARLVTGRVRAHSCVRETCVRRLYAAWGVTICRSSLPFARGCRVGVWFGFIGAALLPAVGTCVVLAFGAMPGRCCFLRLTHSVDDNASGACPTQIQHGVQSITSTICCLHVHHAVHICCSCVSLGQELLRQWCLRGGLSTPIHGGLVPVAVSEHVSVGVIRGASPRSASPVSC